ncbi:glycoside hydrolase domain-containing protein [Kitasatospora sp. NPDC036755]|uniref:glycoside hydrolase domain-containing protein n=1 Tax=Kitasatospora sp. NPDC036755 TaxID=3154600 RepID=UPI00340DFE8C
MNPRISTFLRAVVAAAAAFTVPVAAAGSAQAATPSAASSSTPDVKAVSYQGRVFHVPASWPVVDLAADPRACVRFDQHAVYLGHPGDRQDCPPRLVGRTEALLVEPVAGAAPGGAESNPVARVVRAVDGTVTVTGTYDTDQKLVQGIVTAAGLAVAPPAPRTGPAAGPRVAAKSAGAQAPAAAGAAAVAGSIPASATNYTGKGFDACTAPSGAAMSAWMANSPYQAVGIYIGGSNRACSQPNLTANWVQQQTGIGWHFLPMYVGVQASQIKYAATEGADAADDAVKQAQALGFGPGAVLYYDMENYSPQYTGQVLAFLTAWTNELHAWGFNSGVYSSSSSGMKDLVANAGNSAYAMPDVVFAANWNGTADTNDPYIPAGYWSGHQRVHQYASPGNETWGNVTIGIDQDYLDVQLTGTPPSQSSQFFLGVRQSTGAWPGFAIMPGSGGAGVFKGSETAVTGMPNGSSQQLGVGLDGNLYHATRSATGTLSGFSALNGIGTSTMAARRAAIAGMPDGSSQVLAIGGDGNVYHRIRQSDGSWSGFGPLPGVGTPTMAAADVAITAMPDGSAQVLAIGNDGNVYHESRFSDGNWSGFAPLAGVGTPTMAAGRVAIAGMPDGSSQVLAIGNDGNVYHESRFSNGAWSGFAALPGVGTPTMAARTVGIAGMGDGSSQVAVIGANGNVYHEIRAGNGSWSGFGAVQGPYGSSTFPAQRVAIAGLPDGSSQLVAIRG